MNRSAGSVTGPVQDLRFIERNGESVLQFYREEQELFCDSEDVVVPPRVYSNGPPIKMWRDVNLVENDELTIKFTSPGGGPFTDRILEDATEKELAFLRRTIGNAAWLDNLDDEQWGVLYNEVLPTLHKAELARGVKGERWAEA